MSHNFVQDDRTAELAAEISEALRGEGYETYIRHPRGYTTQAVQVWLSSGREISIMELERALSYTVPRKYIEHTERDGLMEINIWRMAWDELQAEQEQTA
jgi:hypothetical protein